jgi:hypothetical protein
MSPPIDPNEDRINQELINDLILEDVFDDMPELVPISEMYYYINNIYNIIYLDEDPEPPGLINFFDNY